MCRSIRRQSTHPEATMAKTRTVYVCQNCGRTSPREMGRCPGCGEWNTMIEEVEAPETTTNAHPVLGVQSTPRKLSEIEGDPWERLALPMEELDRKSTRLNSSHVKISYA